MMDELIGSAEQLLVQEGEFHPFGAILGEDGRVQEVAPSPVGPPGLDIVGRLAASLKARVAESESARAACIVALVSVQQPGTQEPVDAIRIALDHKQGYSAHVFFPYGLSGDESNPPSLPHRVK